MSEWETAEGLCLLRFLPLLILRGEEGGFGGGVSAMSSSAG